MMIRALFFICLFLCLTHQSNAENQSWLTENRRYIAAHVLLPPYFFTEVGPEGILNAIEKKDNDTFIPVWFAAGFRFTPRFIYRTHETYRIGVISLPAPRKATEAYMAAFVGRNDDSRFGRYFLLELGHDIFTGEPMNIVTEWDRQHKHHNYGRGPVGKDFDACMNAFVKRVIELILQK